MGELEAHIPYIRYMLSVDPGDPAILAMDASARRRKIFDAASALSLRGAALQPLVLVFEDLHWVDTSSEEYLASLMDSVAGVRLMQLRHDQCAVQEREIPDVATAILADRERAARVT